MEELSDTVPPPPSESDARSADVIDQRAPAGPAPDPVAAVTLPTSPVSPQPPPPTTTTNLNSESPNLTLKDGLQKIKAIHHEAEQDENQDKTIADMTQGPYAWLREAAILLAAASALLYAASHIYGNSYLAAYGIDNGFHGFGLANLSMLKFFDMAFLAIFAHSAYRAIHARVWWKFLIELIFIAIGVSSSLLFTGIVQNGFTYNDAVTASFFIALAWGWIYMTRRLTLKFKRNHDSYQESYRSFLKQADFLASESSRIDHAIPDGIMSEIAELSTVAELTRRRLVAVKRRVKMFGIFIGVSIGFLVAFFILPNLARYEAIYSARNNIAEWRAPNGTNPSKIPVYWTGDRIVYITNDGKECLVHLQIASVEQAIRSCPEVITDASAPKK